MCNTELADKDLNLLVALHVLLREQNVTRAAAAIGLSQPAMSRTLARLRRLFDDDLLVRTPRGMVPTPRALALVDPLHTTLESIEHLIRNPRFEPDSATGVFRIAADDHAAMVILPSFLEQVRAEAPGIEVQVETAHENDAALLESDRLDLVLGSLFTAGAATYRRKLFSDPVVCLLRVDHPALDAPWTPERFAALDHAVVATRFSEQALDAALGELGLKRRKVAIFPHATLAPALAASTDLVVTVPLRIAEAHLDPTAVRIMEPPINVPPVTVYQYWHERRQSDRFHAWLRQRMASGFWSANVTTTTTATTPQSADPYPHELKMMIPAAATPAPAACHAS